MTVSPSVSILSLSTFIGRTIDNVEADAIDDVLQGKKA